MDKIIKLNTTILAVLSMIIVLGPAPAAACVGYQCRMVDAPDATTNATGRLMMIKWPSRNFPTLQSAVDSLVDGGTLLIKGGRYEVDQPVIIRDRSINIIGNGFGCEETKGKTRDILHGKELKKYLKLNSKIPSGRGNYTLNRGTDFMKHFKNIIKRNKLFHKKKAKNPTILFAPSPDRVVAPKNVQSIFRYENGGGLLQDVELVGADAGIFGKDNYNFSKPLYVRDSCIRNTGRGILWKAASPLSVEDSIIANTLWNGISISPSAFGHFPPNQVTDMYILDVGNYCFYEENTFSIIANNIINDCKKGGIAASSSFMYIDNNFIGNVIAAGILFEEFSSAWINDNIIWNIASDKSPGGDDILGDGIVAAWPHTNSYIENNLVVLSQRAALSNFGSDVTLNSNKFACQTFDWAGNPSEEYDYAFHNLGDNKCGCPIANDKCRIDSATIEPPDPVGGLE